MENASYAAKMKVMTYTYKKYRDKWRDNPGDDRQLFCNTYDKLLDALEIMKGIDNNTIWCGFNMQYRKDVDMMKEIIGRFEGKELAR